LQGANRTLLHWLKLWDKVVFNRERKVKHRGKEESKKGELGPERFQHLSLMHVCFSYGWQSVHHVTNVHFVYIENM
jgi:hypothetical protein